MISTKLNLTSGEEVTGYYLDEKTKKEIESLLSVRSQLVIDSQFRYLSEQINDLAAEIRKDFYHPQIQKAIVDLLREQDLIALDIRKKVMPNSKKNPQAWRSFWEVWEAFTKAGVLVRIPQEKHHPGKWHLSIRPNETDGAKESRR